MTRYALIGRGRSSIETRRWGGGWTVATLKVTTEDRADGGGSLLVMGAISVVLCNATWGPTGWRVPTAVQRRRPRRSTIER